MNSLLNVPKATSLFRNLGAKLFGSLQNTVTDMMNSYTKRCIHLFIVLRRYVTRTFKKIVQKDRER